jgi:hypothetical protein
MKNILIGTITLLLMLMLNNNSIAQKLTQHNREIEILWNQRGQEKMKIWGNIIRGGKSCKQMKYWVQLENSSNAIKTTIKGFIHNYNPNKRTFFETSKHIKKSKNYRDWSLTGYDFSCISK